MGLGRDQGPLPIGVRWKLMTVGKICPHWLSSSFSSASSQVLPDVGAREVRLHSARDNTLARDSLHVPLVDGKPPGVGQGWG